MSIGFRKSLLRRDVIALAFGAMIGWSWVLLTGEWLVRAGTLGTLVAFVIGSGIVLLISLTYAELAAASSDVAKIGTLWHAIFVEFQEVLWPQLHLIH